MSVPESMFLPVSTGEASIPQQVAPPHATPSTGVLECRLADSSGVDDVGYQPRLVRPYVTGHTDNHEDPECTPPPVPVGTHSPCLASRQGIEHRTLPSLPRSMRDTDEFLRDYLALYPYTSPDSERPIARDGAVDTWSYQRLIAEFAPSLSPDRRLRVQLGRQAVHYSVEQPDPSTPALVYVADGRTDEHIQAVAAAMTWAVYPSTSLTIVSHQAIRAASLATVHTGGRVPIDLQTELQRLDAAQLATIIQGHDIRRCILIGAGSGAAVAAEYAAVAAHAEADQNAGQSGAQVGHVALLGIPGSRRSKARIVKALQASGMAGLQQRRVARAYMRTAQNGQPSSLQTLVGGLRTGMVGAPSRRYVNQSLHVAPDLRTIAQHLATATIDGSTTVALGTVDTRTARSIVASVRAEYCAHGDGLAAAVVGRVAAGGLILGGREESLAVSPRVIAAVVRAMLP